MGYTRLSKRRLDELMGRGKKKKWRTQQDDGLEKDEGTQPKHDLATNIYSKGSAGNEKDVIGTRTKVTDGQNEPDSVIEDDRHNGLSSITETRAVTKTNLVEPCTVWILQLFKK